MTNRNFPARNTLVQLLAAYNDPKSHNAQSVSVSHRQTGGRQDNANSRSHCVAIRSAKNSIGLLYNKICPHIGVLLDCQLPSCN